MLSDLLSFFFPIPVTHPETRYRIRYVKTLKEPHEITVRAASPEMAVFDLDLDPDVTVETIVQLEPNEPDDISTTASDGRRLPIPTEYRDQSLDYETLASLTARYFIENDIDERDNIINLLEELGYA